MISKGKCEFGANLPDYYWFLWQREWRTLLMSCECSVASCMSKSAFLWLQVPQWWSTDGVWTQVWCSRGARICTLTKGCYCSAPQWWVLTSFIPNCGIVKGKSKEELVSLKLLVSNMGPDNGRRTHALRCGQAEDEAKRNLIYFSPCCLVDLSLITISAERLRHSETLYGNLNLSRYLCWEKAAAFPP